MTLKELVENTALPLRSGVVGMLPLPYRVAMAIIMMWPERTEHLTDTGPYYAEQEQLDALLPTGAVLTRVKHGNKHRWGLKIYSHDASDGLNLLSQLI